MFPASVFGLGLCMGELDVCLTEAGPAVVPIPYPNLAECILVDPATTAELVVIECLPALTMISEIMLTEGDEPGEMGGVLCGEFMGSAEYLMGAPTVNIEGAPAVALLSPTMQNEINDLLAMQIVPGAEVVFIAG